MCYIGIENGFGHFKAFITMNIIINQTATYASCNYNT